MADSIFVYILVAGVMVPVASSAAWALFLCSNGGLSKLTVLARGS